MSLYCVVILCVLARYCLYHLSRLTLMIRLQLNSTHSLLLADDRAVIKRRVDGRARALVVKLTRRVGGLMTVNGRIILSPLRHLQRLLVTLSKTVRPQRIRLCARGLVNRLRHWKIIRNERNNRQHKLRQHNGLLISRLRRLIIWTRDILLRPYLHHQRHHLHYT